MASVKFTSDGTGAVARPLADKLGDIISVKDFGAVGNITTDDTQAIQAFVDYLVANNAAGVIPPGSYRLTSTISAIGTDGYIGRFSILNETPYGVVEGSVFLWDGADNGTVFNFENVRESTIQLGKIQPHGTKIIGTAVNVDGPYTTNNVLTYSVHSEMGTVTNAAYVSKTATSGCDLLIFDNCTSYGPVNGLVIDGTGQSKQHNLYDCNFLLGARGIWVKSGSFNAIRPNFSQNSEADIRIDTPDDGVTIVNPSSENSGRYLYVPNQSSAAMTVTTIGGNLRVTSNAIISGFYVDYNFGGSLNFYGTDFANGIYLTAWQIHADNGDPTNIPTLNLIGCIFPNTNPIYSLTSACCFTIGAHEIYDAAGHARNRAPILPAVNFLSVSPQTTYVDTADSNHTWYVSAGGNGPGTFAFRDVSAGGESFRLNLLPNGNVGLAGVGAVGTNGVNVLGIHNGTAPTTSVTDVGQLYVEGGSGKFRTPAGNIVTFAPSSVPNVTGSRGGNAALASLLTQLASLGIITDGTSA